RTVLPFRADSCRRSPLASIHAVSTVTADSAGRLIGPSGAREFPTFLRSAALPFPALPLVEDRVVERFRFTGEELALCCASHNSEPGQIESVRRLLERTGCTEKHLARGPHRPL